MKIALIGIRGIPVIYSGFESFAESLSVELVQKGYEMHVYCRRPYVNQDIKLYKGVNLILLPAINFKNLESITHGFLSTLHAILVLRPQIIYYFGVGNSILSFLPRLFGIKTIVNVDGLDWMRKKWGVIAKGFLFISQYMATVFPNITLTDSQYMHDYYLKHYKKDTVFIPYPFNEELRALVLKSTRKVLRRFKLEKKKYFVWVGRLVPDNHLEDLILAFHRLKTNYKCVIVGDDLFKSKYKAYIKKITKEDKRIIFTGFIGKGEYAAIVKNAYAYIETKRSGGTHPSLIEAMGLGTIIVSNDFGANRMILKNCAIFFNSEKQERQLLKILAKMLSDPFKRTNHLIITSHNIIKREYLFDKILLQYIIIFNRLSKLNS